MGDVFRVGEHSVAGKLRSCPIRMFATREEARAFIEDLRRRP
jgi:hypothetical protein